MDYLDFEVEVSPAATGDYSVRVLRSPAGEAGGTMRFPFDRIALQNRLQALQIALLRSSGTRRRIDLPEVKAVQQFGAELWQAMFTGDVLSRFEVSRNAARTQNAGLRLKLRFTSPELAALPWEYMYDASRGDYVSLSLATPVVRYISLPESMEPLTVQPPLRILGMVVSPDDLAPLDVERERQRLEHAVADLRSRGLVELEWLPGRTWRDLRQALRRGPWHIFHFIGHGGFDELRAEGVVVVADENGRSHRLSATDLGRLLGDHDPLRLAVLNSCESARGDQADVFSSTAAVLVRRGTPAVVAMQYEITDDAAIEFSRSFYEAIADGLPVDTAVSEARKGIAVANSDTLEWGTPVLFMRARDGVLFRVPARAAPMANVEPEPTSREGMWPATATYTVAIDDPPDVAPTEVLAAASLAAGGSASSEVDVPDETQSTPELPPPESHAPSVGAGLQQPSGIRRIPLAIAAGLVGVCLLVIGALGSGILTDADPTPTPASPPSPSLTSQPSPTAQPPAQSAKASTSSASAAPVTTPSPTPTPPVAAWAIDAANVIGGFGIPVGVTIPTEDGLGSYQAFEKGVVYLRPDDIAVPIFGDILGTWRCRLAGEPGIDCPPGRTGPLAELGYPIDRERMQGTEPYQLFDNGGIYCFRQCGYVVFEPVHSIWQSMLGLGIGPPSNDVVASDQLGGSWLGRFQKGFIFVDYGGVEYVACTYDGEIINTSLSLTDCFGFAAAVKAMS